MRGWERSDEEAKVSLAVSEILPWATEWYLFLQCEKRTGQLTIKAAKARRWIF